MKVGIIYDFLSEFGGIERVMKTDADYLNNEPTLYFAYVDQTLRSDPFFKNTKIKEYDWFPIRSKLCGPSSTHSLF